MKFVGRISGIVTYNDNTHDAFAAHRDERGLVSVNSGVGDSPNSSNQAILEVQDENNWLEGMLDLVSEDLELSPAGTAAKVVTGAAMHFSGRIARNNNTWEDFAVQYEIKAGGSFILNSSGTGGTVSAYGEFVESVIENWLGAMIGTANVTVS